MFIIIGRYVILILSEFSKVILQRHLHQVTCWRPTFMFLYNNRRGDILKQVMKKEAGNVLGHWTSCLSGYHA